MFNKGKSRTRKVKMRSYRQTRQMLLVFGMAGLVMGIGLMAVFGLKKNLLLVGVGAIYVLTAMLLLGIRGVLTYVGEINRQRRFDSQARRMQQT